MGGGVDTDDGGVLLHAAEHHALDLVAGRELVLADVEGGGRHKVHLAGAVDLDLTSVKGHAAVTAFTLPHSRPHSAPAHAPRARTWLKSPYRILAGLPL